MIPLMRYHWSSDPAFSDARAKSLLKITRLLVMLLLCALCSSAFASSKPNILIILADDMGYSDAGCYGGDISTPNLDALAKGGLRFTQFYNTARCWPSRAAILTGYYAQEIRRDTVPGVPKNVRTGGGGIRPGWARLLPEMLRPMGYRTYHSGKWHVDGKPLQNGFDHSYDLEDHNHNFSPKKVFEDDVQLPPVEPNSGYYTATAFADHAIKCLKEHAAKYGDRPFFEYLAFTVPHFPLQAPPENIAHYRGRYDRGWDIARQERWERMKKIGVINCDLSALEREVGPPYYFPDAFEKLGPGESRYPVPWRELTDAQRVFQSTKMSIHAAMVERMDQEIGRVLDQVKAMSAFNNTLIFFLSDNGASAEIMVRGDGHDPSAPPGSAASYLCLGPGWSSAANTPFRRHKTWVHEGGIATPLIVHWPAGIPARNELRHTPGHLVDLVPTILEVAGSKPFTNWDGKPVPPPPGKSLVPAFAKDNTVSRNSIWWYHEGNRALRVGDWKIVAAGEEGPWELYNLKTDRSEMQNLAGKFPDRVGEMEQAWAKEMDAYRKLALTDLPPEDLKARPGKKGKAAKVK